MSDRVVDLNTATAEELNKLPGMTQEILEQILRGRPYAAVEDLKNIQGINAKLYKRWKSNLYIGKIEGLTSVDHAGDNDKEPISAELEKVEGTPTSTPESTSILESSAPGATPEGTSEVDSLAEGETSGEITSSAPPQAQEEPPTPSKSLIAESVAHTSEVEKAESPLPGTLKSSPWFTRTQTVLLILLGSGASFIMAVIVVLIVLIFLNDGLRYASLADFNRISSQFDQLSNQLSSIQADLQLAEARLGKVDELSVQVGEVQSQMEQARADLRAIITQTEAMQNSISLISRDVESLKSRSAVFDAFLSGLRRLLSSLSEP